MANDDTQPKPPEDVLEITLDDLNALPAELPPVPAEAPALDLGSELFPPIEADAPVTDSRQPWVEITGVCARDRRNFAVRFVENTPGVYTFSQAEALGAMPSAKPSVLGKAFGAKAPGGMSGGMGGSQGQAQGRFDLAAYRGCPCCGQQGLVQCDRCGAIMCGAAIREDRRGLYCQCPSCGGKGRLAPGGNVTVAGAVGGVKGKKGKM